MHSPVDTKLGLPLWTFIVATTLSFAGSFLQKIAVGWSAWELTHATAWVAAASLADLLPTLILSFPAGAIIDRFHPAKTFWVSQIASTLQALALFVLAASGQLSLGPLLACAVFLGACNAFTLPARLAYMMQLAPRGAYSRIVALYSIGGNAAFFAGPMIAGELLSGFGSAVAYAANALAYLPTLLLVATLPKIETHSAGPAADPDPSQVESSRAGLLQKMREGFLFALRTHEVLTMLLCFAAAALTARGVMELAPSIAATALHGDVKTLSHLTSAIGVGAILAGLWMSSRGRGWPARTTIIATLSGSALALLGYGASGQIAIALAGAAVLGFVLAINNISVTSAIQLHSPLQYRGRINSLYNMIFKGGPAIGAIIFGALAQVTNVRLASAAAALVLSGLMVWLATRASSLPRPKPTEPQDEA